MKSPRTLAGRCLASLPVVSAFAALVSTTSAQSLGQASDYNYFVFGDVSLMNSDAEGRVAVGGNATFTSYGIGNKLNSATAGNSLIVGGDLTYTDGQVFYGDTIIGGTAQTTGFNVQNGVIKSGTPIDFNAAQAELLGISSSLAGIAVNGTYTNSSGSLLFTGTDAALNTFFVQGGDINSAHTFKVDAPSGSTVVINVAGSSITWDNMGIQLSSVEKFNVLYNFYEATDLTLASIGINGSILAPEADVIFNNGQFEGTLVSKSLDGTGEFHHVPFKGSLPVPEPSAIFLAATGTGLALLRRKR